MAGPVEQALSGTIELAGRPWATRGSVHEEFVNVYAHHQTLGEPGPDDHPINSTFIQRNWEGGGQVKKGNPAQDINRFWWSTCDTLHPEAITLPPYTWDYTFGSAGITPIMLGDHNISGTYYLFAASGADVYRWDATTDVWTLVGTAAHTPTAAGFDYTIDQGANAGKTWLFVPAGTAGYITIDDTGALGAGAADATVSFEMWDQKLFRLSPSGVVSWKNDTAVAFADVGRVTDGSIPRKLVSGWDFSQSEALFVVTNNDVYILDFDTTKLRKTKFHFPRHPMQGLGAVEHEGLTVSVGMGMHKQTGDLIISDQGLDRARGLPMEFRGHIHGLESAYGLLYALVHGMPPDGLIASSETVALDMGGPDGMYGVSVPVNTVVMVWNGRGWHYRWHVSGGVHTNIYASNAQDTYRIWWGADYGVHAQKVTTTFFAPQDFEGTGEYAESCEFISFNTDWGWVDIPKILKSVALKVIGSSSSEFVEVAVRLDSDEESDWLPLGTIQSDGKFEWRINPDPDAPTLFRGKEHNEVAWRLTLHRAAGASNKALHPVVQWTSVVARKWLKPQRTWRLTLDLTQKQHDYTPEEAFNYLSGLANQPEGEKQAVAFNDNHVTTMVEVAGVSADYLPAQDAVYKYVQVHLIEAYELDAQT